MQLLMLGLSVGNGHSYIRQQRLCSYSTDVTRSLGRILWSCTLSKSMVEQIHEAIGANILYLFNHPATFFVPKVGYCRNTFPLFHRRDITFFTTRVDLQQRLTGNSRRTAPRSPYQSHVPLSRAFVRHVL